jgi:hypothetical protein
METAVRLDINLTIVVLNDNGFGMIKWKQNAAGYSMLVPLHSLFLVSTWNHHADNDRVILEVLISNTKQRMVSLQQSPKEMQMCFVVSLK